MPILYDVAYCQIGTTDFPVSGVFGHKISPGESAGREETSQTLLDVTGRRVANIRGCLNRAPVDGVGKEPGN